MDTYQHSLVVGCTGMLQAAAIQIAKRSQVMTAVARTGASLQKLETALPESVQYHAIQADWQQGASFHRTILQHVDKIGLPDLVVLWVHGQARAVSLIRALRVHPITADIFHVIGSTVDPHALAQTIGQALDVGVRVRCLRQLGCGHLAH